MVATARSSLARSSGSRPPIRRPEADDERPFLVARQAALEVGHDADDVQMRIPGGQAPPCGVELALADVDGQEALEPGESVEEDGRLD
jgi:hypothetical protein